MDKSKFTPKIKSANVVNIFLFLFLLCYKEYVTFIIDISDNANLLAHLP